MLTPTINNLGIKLWDSDTMELRRYKDEFFLTIQVEGTRTVTLFLTDTQAYDLAKAFQFGLEL